MKRGQEVADAAGCASEPRRRRQARGKIKRLPAEVREELNERLVRGGFSDYRGLSRWLEGKGYEISPSALNYYARRFEQRLDAVRLATAQARAVVDAAPDDDSRINQALMKIVQTTLFEMMVDLHDTRQKLGAVGKARATGAARGRKRRAATAKAGGEVDTEADAGTDGGADGVDEAAEPISGEEQAGADAPRYPTKADLAAVGSVGRTVASLARVELEWRKWREQTREKVERQVGVASETLSEAANGGGLSSEAEQKIRAALLDIRV